MVAEVQTQEDENGKFLEDSELIQELKRGFDVADVAEPVSIPIATANKPTTPTKKPLTLGYLSKKIQEKPLVKVEIAFEGETLICYRKDNMPVHILERLRSKSEERNTLKVLLDAVSGLTLDEQGKPLGTREMWAEFDIDILNSVLQALYESSNKVGEA